MSTKSDISGLGEVETDRVDDEMSREERQERLLGLYREMNGGKSQSKGGLIACGVISVIAIVTLCCFSQFVISSLGPASSTEIWVAYAVFVLLIGLSLAVVLSSVRSHHEVTLAWVDAWKKTEIEEIRQSARKRDDKTFLAMYEMKLRCEMAKRKPCLERRNTDQSGGADSDESNKEGSGQSDKTDPMAIDRPLSAGPSR